MIICNLQFYLFRYVFIYIIFTKSLYSHTKIVINKFFTMKRIFVFVFVFVFSIFLNTNNLFANVIDNSKDNISKDIVEIKPENRKKSDIPNSSAEDIFGDEQTFPFVAGLGKNAAH